MRTGALRPAGLVLAAIGLGAVLYGSLRAATVERQIGEPAAYVHVRWDPALDPDARARLEAAFELRLPEPLQDSVYGYFLDDVSRANIEALVSNAAVLDTQDIDRAAFTIAPTAERAILAPDDARRVTDARHVRTVLSSAGLPLLLLGVLLVAAPARVQHWSALTRAAARTRWVPWLQARVPEASPQAVAVFRVVLAGGLVLLTTIVRPADPVLPEAPPAGAPAAVAWTLAWIRSAPGVLTALAPWISVSGALVAAGAFTRISYPALVAGVGLWAIVYVFQFGSHPVAALVLTLLCLLPSRWSDAWSLDAWRRPRRPAASRGYGYTLWMPGFVVGVALFAAGIAKLRAGGLSWIANGTIKYHFLTDAAQAPVDWGLRLGQFPALAVLLSGTAIGVELLILPAVLAGRYPARALAGLAAASLFAGFWLFQGLFWPGWWLLIVVGFLPWHLIARTTGGPAPSGALAWAQIGTIVVIGALQLGVSADRIEWPPLLSAYDMYSTTYDGPDAYEAASTRAAWVVADRAGTAAACEVTLQEAGRVVDAAGGDRDARETARAVMTRCFPNSPDDTTVRVEVLRRQVDWENWRPLGEARVALSAPVPIDTLR